MARSSNGIVLGVKNGSYMVQGTDSKLRNRNHAVIGGSGSQKTQSYVITNVLNERECSIGVTDPKGEVYEKTAGIKEKQGYEVHVINFMNMAKSDRWNAFDYVKKDIQASTVANAFVAAKNNPDKKDVWYLSQRSLLKSLILYAKYEFPPEKRNMSGILDFLQDYEAYAMEDEDVSELDQQFLNLEPRHPARRSYQLGFMKSEDKVRASILISLMATIDDFIDEEVSEFTSFSDFYLGDIGKRKIALYVIIPVMDDTWEGLINLFFVQMFDELYKVGAENGAKLPQPVNFILDEFPNLGKFTFYEKFLATCRGYGIAVATVLQNLTQLQATYGKERAESILGNHTVKICLGGVNETTAEYFSREMDKATVKVETGSQTHSKGKNESNSSSDSYSFTGRNLKTPGEIITMPDDESIVLIGGLHPIIAKKSFQYELFPGATELFPKSQVEYERKTSAESLRQSEIREKEYQEYIAEKYPYRKENAAKLEQERKEEKKQKEEDLTAAANAFFFSAEDEQQDTVQIKEDVAQESSKESESDGFAFENEAAASNQDQPETESGFTFFEEEPEQENDSELSFQFHEDDEEDKKEKVEDVFFFQEDDDNEKA
ncbi:type IV secretory system conjugative DNA transfer family protein [Bacillus atrophaeus]|uniref:VirD4-like conjugal transfer protein, CD1115 family n=1 Tax=Bacillus atrophaeus TaxID=1452 RepID=UPI0022830649|nr:type IV secretory system conjugative DNA transfer family protein [Bacillus atrophaeus]MCY8497760.1 type IV secretory system conjugative DNA transfer family protein [Bacillus atrophaeus]MCY8814935.1 type IV secretory system conjugative DNA transfer family protein [Bacillus atrophaeus]MCY8821563.1 type IV secretory system conjugative DNA transfer family protein [Bacillus atrophaeus]MCY8830993.1 type IV secretory system conjugative DNA transfer family protein [Bacillus atrophaeus]MCY8835252.1 